MRSTRWLLLVLLLPVQVLAQTVGKVTFVEGRLRVVRDAALLQGAPGAAVEVGDFIETSKPGFALVEFSDGTVFALGDATRVMLGKAPAAKSAGELMLLDGWLKLQARVGDEGAGYAVASPTQAATLKTASLIVHGTPGSGEAFVESGTAMLGTTDKRGRASGYVPARAGQFVTRMADKAPTTLPRPAESFLSGMPSAFRDALPSRLDRFKDRNVELRAVGPASYADVADRLSAPAGWRAGFIKRFEPRLADAAFRQQLDAHMKSHPEWDRVLHPPKSN